MRARCNDPKHKGYKDYGARGITVCPEWDHSHGFKAFLEHVGPRPSNDHSIDRIENSLGYEPGNVKWATRSEQNRNKRTNVTLTAFGETMCVAAWAEKLSISEHTIWGRLKANLPVEEVLSPERRVWRRQGERFEAFGKSQTLKEWGKEYGIKPDTLFARMKRSGATLEQALSRRVCPGLRFSRHPA